MFRSSRNHVLAASALLAAISWPPSTAHADDPPSARSAGTFEATRGTPATANDDTRFRLQLGVQGAGGNTRSFGMNTSTRFQIRRGIHQFTLDGAANLGWNWNLPSMIPDSATQATIDALRAQTLAAQNVLFRGRYDIFVTENNAFYAAPQFFHDLPAGFNSRLSLQLGYARNFVNVPNTRRFYGEVGIDLTYENTTQAPTGQMSVMGQTAYDRFMPLARLFLGFEDKANRAFEFNVGAEGLLDLSRPTNFRLNATAGINSRISDWFSIGLQATLRVLTEPIPVRAATGALSQINRDAVDITTLATAVFQFAPAAPTPPPPAPPPAPTCPPCPDCAGRPASTAPAPSAAPAGDAQPTGDTTAPSSTAPSSPAGTTTAPGAAGTSGPATNPATTTGTTPSRP